MIEHKRIPELNEWAQRQLMSIPRAVSSEDFSTAVHLVDDAVGPGPGGMGTTMCNKSVKRRVGDRSTPNCKPCLRATGLPPDLILTP